MNLLIVGCSRRKLDTPIPVAALDLYQGWCVPRLRARVGGDAMHRAGILVLSALHGLIPADAPLLPYDQPLTPERVTDLEPLVGPTLTDRLVADPPDEVLLLLEPDYLSLIIPALAWQPPTVVHWVARPDQDWPQVAALLDRWGWP